MNIKDSPTGKVIKTLTGYEAFIPYPLPPVIAWNNALINALSRADHLLGKLSREGSKLSNPHLLMRPLIAREAVLSSKIEGTQATLGEVLAHDAGMDGRSHPHDLQEIANYIVALDYGIERLKDFPLSLRLIREMHERLMQGVRGAHATPGEFRRTQNWIGFAGSTLSTATYVPPTPDELMNCLGTFEKFLHDRTLPPLVHVALCHYQFEAIHPFLDGNGRIGRLLISLLLVERGALPGPLLYLSAFFEATRDEYYRQLFSLSAKGTWEDWLLYFLNGVAIQSLDVLSRAERINDLLVAWQIQVASAGQDVAKNVVKLLAVNPYITAKKIAAELDVAFTTAQRAIAKLEAEGIVIQASEGKRDRVYCAKQILDILEEPTKLTEGLDGVLR